MVSWKSSQPNVLWMHLQLVGNPCIFMPFPLAVKFTDACKRFWRNKYLRESRSYHFGLLNLVATTAENVNCNPICLAEAGGPTFTITLSSNTTSLRRKLTMLACRLSGNPSRIEEFQRRLLSSSWPPGETEQRNSTVPILQSDKSFVIRGRSATFNHAISARPYIQCHQYSPKCFV